MSGRLWSRCLSVWMGKSQRILAWSLLTTFFRFYSPVFTVLKIVLSTYGLVYYWVHTVVSFSLFGFCKLAAAAGNMYHGFCMLFAQPASWILHSVVDLVWHWPAVEVFALMLLLLSHWYVGAMSANSDTPLCQAPCRLLIPGCSFIWLFSDGYKALAFSDQWVTFCFTADIGLQALLFLVHNIFDVVQTPSSFFSAGV